VGFLRRLLGGGGPAAPADRPPTGEAEGGSATLDQDADAEERAHELELARFEQDRTTDLMRRQQRYGNRSWTPPAQGGSRRAEDDSDAPDQTPES
jgi:hypothetical protein